MENTMPLVTVIIPSRNEEKFIENCLNCVMSQTYPRESLEIFVVDGMSDDRTREILEKYSKEIKVFDNFKKIFPAANNIGIKKSKGEIIMILGSHAIYPVDYIEKCVKYLRDYKADNAGTNVVAKPSKNTLMAKAIAFSLGGYFGKGIKKVNNEAVWVDTVFGGCYNKNVFERIGLFNENLAGSSDMDFNMRLTRSGGKIIFVPDLKVFYYPKNNLKDFFFHNIRDGVWAILPFKFTKKPMKLRHYIPLAFILTLPISIFAYIPAALYFSAKIAARQKDARLFFVMPIVFASRHIGHGIGSLWGIIKILIL